MPQTAWLPGSSPAFRLMIATSWLAPDTWQGKQEQAIREAFEAGPEWAEYLRLVDRHRTPALSWSALKRVPGLDIPEQTKRELHQRSDACRMQAVRHAQQLRVVLNAFNQAGIPAMTLKGPILSFELYGDVALRHCRDLDLEIDLKDMSRVRACLENHGYIPERSYFPLTARQEKSFLLHEYHVGFVSSQGGVLLELHWRNQWDPPGQTTARRARSIPSVWQGCSYLAMNLVDQVLYLCSHGGEHAWCRAKWLGDLARICTDRTVDWESVLEEARRSNQEKPLLAGLRLMKDIYGLTLPRLSGDPWKGLHAFLIGEPLRHLRILEEPEARSTVARLRDGIHKSLYDRRLKPRTTWLQSLAELAYHREDFRTLPLPDGLFWAYVPLRPILWAWRKLRPGKAAKNGNVKM